MRKKQNLTTFAIFIMVSIVTGVFILTGCTQQPITPGLNTVSIDNLAFNPNTLTVSNGTTITWKNTKTGLTLLQTMVSSVRDSIEGQDHLYIYFSRTFFLQHPSV
jgi:plastocyanin